MASQARPLNGLGVLVTRPAHQADGLCRTVEQAGGRAVRLPLLSIDAPADAQAVADRLQAGRDDDLWIFTSPNAVAWAARLYPPDDGRRWPSTLAAAGGGTAAALRALGGGKVLLPPQRDGAAGLLALPELQRPAGLKLLIVSGERPLSLLADGLRQRGSPADTVVVYRRHPLRHPPEQVTQALAAADAAVISSGESLHQLCDLTPPMARERLLALQLAVPSARVLELARQLGFHPPPLLPDRVGDEGFTQALIRWRLAIEQESE